MLCSELSFNEKHTANRSFQFLWLFNQYIEPGGISCFLCKQQHSILNVIIVICCCHHWQHSDAFFQVFSFNIYVLTTITIFLWMFFLCQTIVNLIFLFYISQILIKNIHKRFYTKEFWFWNELYHLKTYAQI
jgi:hypothetical protein